MDQKLLDALVARAEQRARSMAEAKQFFMPGVGMVEFVKPKQAAQIEYYGALAESRTPEDALRRSVSGIYDCCLTLQDAGLHAALGVKDPYDVVWKLLEPRQIDVLGGKLLEWAGIVGDGAEEQAKN